MPDIVSKLLRAAIWILCAVLFESKQTPFFRRDRRFRSAALLGIRIGTCCFVPMSQFFSETVVACFPQASGRGQQRLPLTWKHPVFVLADPPKLPTWPASSTGENSFCTVVQGSVCTYWPIALPCMGQPACGRLPAWWGDTHWHKARWGLTLGASYTYLPLLLACRRYVSSGLMEFLHDMSWFVYRIKILSRGSAPQSNPIASFTNTIPFPNIVQFQSSPECVSY